MCFFSFGFSVSSLYKLCKDPPHLLIISAFDSTIFSWGSQIPFFIFTWGIPSPSLHLMPPYDFQFALTTTQWVRTRFQNTVNHKPDSASVVVKIHPTYQTLPLPSIKTPSHDLFSIQSQTNCSLHLSSSFMAIWLSLAALLVQTLNFTLIKEHAFSSVCTPTVQSYLSKTTADGAASSLQDL